VTNHRRFVATSSISVGTQQCFVIVDLAAKSSTLAGLLMSAFRLIPSLYEKQLSHKKKRVFADPDLREDLEHATGIRATFNRW